MMFGRKCIVVRQVLNTVHETVPICSVWIPSMFQSHISNFRCIHINILKLTNVYSTMVEIFVDLVNWKRVLKLFIKFCIALRFRKA